MTEIEQLREDFDRLTVAYNELVEDAERFRGLARTMAEERDQARAQLDPAREAARRLTAVLVANAGLLDKPFTNAPDLSPWTRGVSPALNGLRSALGMAHAPVQLCTAVSGDGVRCTSVADHPNLTLAGMPFNHANPEAGVFWNDSTEGDPA